MEWGHPENMIWLLLIPLIAGLAYYFFQWKKQAQKKFADFELLSKLFPETSKSRNWGNVFLIILGVLFATLALMDPLAGEEEVKVQREGIDIVYALDLSNSMYAEDVAPSRLEKAKKIITESIDKLGGDRVGLIVFAADAYRILPLTTDYAAAKSYVETASPGLISHQGTNFSSVVKTAEETFDKNPSTGKLLVIISDGEDNDNSIAKAVDAARKSKIHIVTMGVGSAGGAPIPMIIGGYEEYKMDRYGETVISKLSEDAMQELSASTSGIYIPVNQTERTLSNLHSYINQFDKEVKDQDFGHDKKHIFQWFLGVAFFFIFIDTLTSGHQIFNNKR
ncbi:MAG: VWA domain-containing protein [Weeksellaceae bacterium]